jgi:sugar phosphate isomerase/epimerase
MFAMAVSKADRFGRRQGVDVRATLPIGDPLVPTERDGAEVHARFRELALSFARVMPVAVIEPEDCDRVSFIV